MPKNESYSCRFSFEPTIGQGCMTVLITTTMRSKLCQVCNADRTSKAAILRTAMFDYFGKTGDLRQMMIEYSQQKNITLQEIAREALEGYL